MTRFYLSLFPWIPFAPIFIMIVAVFVSARMSMHRWAIHIGAFAALFLTLPLYIWTCALLDPTTIEYPGPGDGFVVLLYLFFLVPMTIGYSAYVWLGRRKIQARSAL
jgi:hypothetical protein